MPAVDLILGSGGLFAPQDPLDLTLRLGPPPGTPESPFAISVAATLTFSAAIDAAAVTPASVGASITFGVSLAADRSIGAQVAATLTFGAALTAGYDTGLVPYVVRMSGGAWRDGAPARNESRAAWSDAQRLLAQCSAAWRDAARRQADSGALPWRDAALRYTDAGRVPWRDGTGLAHGSDLPWRDAAASRPAPTVFPWRDAVHIRIERAAPWQDAARIRKDRGLPWQDAAASQHARALAWREGARRYEGRRLPWRDGAFVGTHGGWPFPPPPVPPIFVPPVDLQFCQVWVPKNPLALPLILGTDPCGGRSSGATTWIPIRSVYMTVHTIDAVRLSDMLPLDLFSADISADDGSFGWQLSATGPASLLDLLAPSGGAPAQIRVTLDGLAFAFVVEGLRRTREFGKTAASITGRSLTALVGEPYMPQASLLNGSTMLAQQLAASALDLSGVALEWGVTDWLVPAGAWSFTGSPLAAVQRIAEAAGAIVQSARNAATLRVLPRYPALPWDWATTIPDVEFPSAVVVREGWERSDRPGYNGIYVSGQNQGVLGFVKRTGTAGDVQASMVTDALITHADAARQRGGSILGAAGPQARVAIELPVLTGASEPGIIDVGKLVQVNDGLDVWRGLVRSVSVRSARPSLRQTLTLERHL